MIHRSRIFFALAIVLGAAICTYALINYHSSQPFNYAVGVSPIDKSMMQGQTISTNITVSYLQGTPQPVSLNVITNSESIQTILSNPTGIPKPNEPYTSNLTICISNSAKPDIYQITVTSNSNNQKHSSIYNMTIIDSEINVFGTFNVSSNESIFPYRLQFVSQQNYAIYSATLNYPSMQKTSTNQQQAIYNVNPSK